MQGGKGNIARAIEYYHKALSLRPEDTLSTEMLTIALQVCLNLPHWAAAVHDSILDIRFAADPDIDPDPDPDPDLNLAEHLAGPSERQALNLHRRRFGLIHWVEPLMLQCTLARCGRLSLQGSRQTRLVSGTLRASSLACRLAMVRPVSDDRPQHVLWLIRAADCLCRRIAGSTPRIGWRRKCSAD